MSGWPRVRLGDCAKIVSGSTPKTSVDKFWDGDINWATPKDLSALDGHVIESTTRTITATGLGSCGASVLPPGSVLFSSRAPIGLVAVNAIPMATNQGFKSFIPKPDLLVSGYLAHWLRANRKHLESLGNGATFKEISKAVAFRIEIPLPPVLEQRRIAEVLDRAEALRRQRRRVLGSLDDLTKCVFLEMFGNPVLNPHGWPTSPVRSIGRVITGNTPARRATSYYGGNVEWIKSDNLGRGTYATHAAEALSDEGLAVAKSAGPDAVLVTCIAGTPSSIGNAAIVNRRVAFNQQINAIVPTTMNTEFLYAQLLVGKSLVQIASSGGMKGMVSKSRFEQIRLLDPPIELQQNFAHKLELVEEVGSRSRRHLKELDFLFGSLQHRAFAGTALA